jgi:hypothetical protein
VLEAVINIFSDVGEEKQIGFHEIQEEVDYLCKERHIEAIRQGPLLNFMEELAFYNIISIIRNKKEIKASKFALAVEHELLSKEMQKCIDE